MASVSYQIANLLEKMQSNDKDFRFMATNDLMSELQKDSIKLDDDSERKVVRMLLKLLEDKNGEVQNLAVKCLGPLVNKVKEVQVESIVETLCTNMISDKEQLRDISSIGLKTVIAELPQATGGLSGNICRKITGRLTTAIEREDVSVQLEALDIISDLLFRFGTVLQSFHGMILTALLPQLSSQRQAIRKRTITACSNLVPSCNPALYNKIIEYLYNGLCSDVPSSQMRTYVQCVAAVCRQSGQKFGEFIPKFVPLILRCSEVDDDELREFSLQAFESFVTRCPKEITEHIPNIIDLSLRYMTYDPNYNYDEDEVNMEDMEGCEDEDDAEDNDEYSDDDDMSWKVRRSAAKCLESVISTRHDLLSDFYVSLSPALIGRFKEREENVKSDIFHAYIALLKQTKSTINHNVDPDSMEQEEVPLFLLQKQVPLLVKGLQNQMKEKSMKTRQDCFHLLKELCNALPGALAQHIGDIIPGLLYSLGEKNVSSNMKIEALSFIHTLLTSHHPEAFHPYINVLLPPIINAVGDSFYKITAEALNVLQELVKVIRPLNMKSQFDYEPYVPQIYQCTLVRLKAADIDQEVKEKAISTMGQIICNFGDELQHELPTCLPIYIDRLKNEITRLTCVKALTKIAGSPLEIELPILGEGIPILASFLRKNQRALKLGSLQLLNVLFIKYQKCVYVDMIECVIVELPPLLDEADLHIAQWTLVILKSIAEHYPAALKDINNTILPQIMKLVKSPLLQGSALNALLDFFRALVKCNLPELTFNHLIQKFVEPITKRTPCHLHKQAFYSLAKCVAAITVTCQSHALPIVPQFIQEIQKAENDTQQIFALLVVGEIGREIDLTPMSNLKPVILQSFSAVSEEVKSAASYALGSISIGNLEQYLPFILKESEEQPKRQYLLLHSLKEVITCLSATPAGVQQLLPFVPAIWTQLYRHCECTEEGTRNVVAECLGKLTLIDPANLLPQLKASLKSESPFMRTTVVTAIKFTISDQPSAIDPLLRQCIAEFLNALEDPDLNVRRVALVAFNSAAHNKPSLIRDLLNQVLPQLYIETKVRKELIREVEMGPFKHTVDDGLDIRKAAFECMYTILDSCLDRIDIFDFIDNVEGGLKDHYDIKMLTYLMVARLAQICPGAVLQRLDRLVEPLRATCTMKVKANSVKQEYEKQDELKRSALRAVHALLSIPDADKNPQLQDFVNQIKNSSELDTIFESVKKDSSSSNHNECVMMDQS
ncbi:cullin-associated NEDD8-dissociated protein 1 [Coccinella septempunctata]|uniref:cullin-associated NEDD8-dissociated protein 1 n=1 Tax=Coccinella septempunctata TaxID=41139 RepID=UPI001D06C98A|nr:cullin-associated NEDD8-dissociated protein 1 [Coccinella septempunctata]XP_044761677.1 cullin-associated NEDD8-dissociated protein 1 [Coccinella septempunctata]